MNKNHILWCITLIIIIVTYIFTQLQTPKETILYSSNEDAKKHGRMSVEGAQNFYKNDDITGYVDIPGTSIHFFFVQGNDNTFYLNNNLNKRNSILGSIFMDYRNTLNDKQINLYGHNGNIEKAPFYDLKSYKEKSFYLKNPYIDLYLPKGEKRKYKIFSVIITKESHHMNFSNEKKEENLSFYLKNKLYTIEENVDSDDNLLILQTCSYEDKNTLLLLISKEIKGDTL